MGSVRLRDPGLLLSCRQGTVEVEQKRDLHLRQFENNDAVAREIREARWDSQSRLTAAYGLWALVGFALASAAST